MGWVYLVMAGLFEVVWAVGLKYSENFTRLLPSLLTVAGMIVSFWLLSLALRTLPLGTAYAVWTGIGAIGTATFGLLFLHEPAHVARLVCLGLIIAGVVGLKLFTPG